MCFARAAPTPYLNHPCTDALSLTVVTHWVGPWGVGKRLSQAFQHRLPLSAPAVVAHFTVTLGVILKYSAPAGRATLQFSSGTFKD